MTAMLVAASVACAAVLVLTRPPPPLGPSSRSVGAEGAVFGIPHRVVRRLAARRAQDLVVQDVPVAADLLVAALEAGVPVPVALDHVGRAVGGVLGQALGEAARAQHVGADGSRATAALRERPETAPIGRAVARATSSGSSPARVLAAAADSERVRVRSTRVSRARTAGSLAALPVGLAFLPAFVLVAVVPIVVGSLSAMLAAG